MRSLGHASVAVVLTSIAAQTPPPAATLEPVVRMTLSVSLSSQRAEIAPEIYGQFIEHTGNVIYDGVWVGEGSSIANIRGIRKDVVDALKPLQIPLLRWPGGCFADQYNWRDGIGPRDKRPKRYVAFYNSLESNAFGTHEYMDFAEQVGAKPYISLNIGSMTALDSVRWLEYINGNSGSTLTAERQENGRALPWNVKYVGLGNEIWGCGGNMRPGTAADETRRYGFYVDSDVVRYSSQRMYKIASGPSYNFPGCEAFTEAMMKESVNIFGQMPFQALSLHYYATQLKVPSASELMPAIGFAEQEWIGVLKTVRRMEDAISLISGIMDKYDPEKKIALAFDEWDPSMQGPQVTLLKGQLAALALNIFHRHSDRVRIASPTFLINIGNALIQTHGDQMILTPVNHVYSMYRPFKGAKPYSVSFVGNRNIQDAVPMVDASAALGSDGKLYLALVNFDQSSTAEVLTNLTGTAEGSILSGPGLDTYNWFDNPRRIEPKKFRGGFTRDSKLGLLLPAKSVVVVAVR